MTETLIPDHITGSTRLGARETGCQEVTLVIADPPYPALRGAGGTKQRASRWYGTKQRSRTDVVADIHPDAAAWDLDATHRALLEQLMDEADGWAIATSPDGIAAYGPLPHACRIMAWVKPNAQPGAHRLRSTWEPVILYPPKGRRSNRGGVGSVPDTLVCPVNTRSGFRGQKPAAWTRWVLDALTYRRGDVVIDMFPGSGAIDTALRGIDPPGPISGKCIGEECKK